MKSWPEASMTARDAVKLLFLTAFAIQWPASPYDGYPYGNLTDSFSLRRANAQQPKLFVGMILILIFAEALALYGLIGKHFPCFHDSPSFLVQLE